MPKGGVPILEVFFKDILFALMQKDLVEYVQPTLMTCILAASTFDLWKSKGHMMCLLSF
jgi:hypothetical protein